MQGTRNGRSPNVRLASKVESLPTKMSFPALLARVKEESDGIRLRINAGEIRPFVQIAVDASETEI